MSNEKKILNRCCMGREKGKTCNNSVSGNRCVAVTKPDFVGKCPFYRNKNDTPREEMKYHVPELVGVEIDAESKTL